MLTPFHHEEPPVKERNRLLSTALVASLIVGMAFGFLGGLVGSQYAPEIAAFISGNDKKDQAEIQRTKSLSLSVKEESATVDVVKRASSSVVSIVVTKDLSSLYRRTGPNIFPFDDIFDFGTPFRVQLPDGGKQQVGGGSGFIVSSDGLILTNKHVVADETAEYTVVTNDGKEYAAKVLDVDPFNDVAVVKIEASGLTPLELGDSSTVQIGQTVIAIGNSLGEYSNTVTRGVISGIDRVVQAASGSGTVETLQGAIQTDAAINQGNSGGPLLNLAGQVIGINTAINRAGQSIGFALPINIAERTVESVKKHGRIIRPWIGIRYVLIDASVQKRNNLPVGRGALIAGSEREPGVIKGGPADKAGLQEGDIILSVGDARIEETTALSSIIAEYAPGDTISLRVMRDGKERDVTVTLEEYARP